MSRPSGAVYVCSGLRGSGFGLRGGTSAGSRWIIFPMRSSYLRCSSVASAVDQITIFDGAVRERTTITSFDPSADTAGSPVLSRVFCHTEPSCIGSRARFTATASAVAAATNSPYSFCGESPKTPSKAVSKLRR